MTVDASLVLPLQGGPEQALRCFTAVSSLSPVPAHEVIVVDDASSGLESLLARLEGDVDVVRTGRRLGFAAAAGQGAERARGRVVVLVRDAAEPQGDWLAPLVAALDDPAVGLAASATAGELATHPVAAYAVAVRADDLRALGGLPSAPDEFAIAALCTAITAAGGRAEGVTESVVAAPGVRGVGLRRPPGEEVELTVVIPTLDGASERVRRCVAAVQSTTDVAHEIVVLDNGSPPQGFTAPVNAGLRAARGRYAVVMNDDVEPLPGWWPPLREELDAGASVAFPLTVDGAMRRDFAAWCFAISADGLLRHGHAPGELFDPAFTVWFQDSDLLERLRQVGDPPRCVDESRIRHGLSETVATEDPALREWIHAQIARDTEAFLAKWPGVAVPPAALAIRDAALAAGADLRSPAAGAVR